MVGIEAMLGYVLLLVGFVFFCNGMTVLGKTGAKEVGVLNFAVGVLILIAAWELNTLGLPAATALVSVFALIYFMVAGIFIHGYDAKGLGWYCLFATIVFVWYGLHFYSLVALGLPDMMYFAIFCWAWALLVFLAFLVFSLGKAVAPAVAWLFLIEAFLTLLIPGMMLLTDKWNPLGGVPG
ncbi:MAG: putative transporter protein AmiS [Thermodesulfobacteriota bacterium]|nr:MAG: putative transporter protein AmiS [Thermodesulfobacteriota bacterium]